MTRILSNLTAAALAMTIGALFVAGPTLAVEPTGRGSDVYERTDAALASLKLNDSYTPGSFSVALPVEVKSAGSPPPMPREGWYMIVVLGAVVLFTQRDKFILDR
jgi:hypothetical protein